MPVSASRGKLFVMQLVAYAAKNGDLQMLDFLEVFAFGLAFWLVLLLAALF